MQFQDYYKTLEVERTATADEIKKSYRRLSKKFHPDVNVGSKDAEEKFKQIGEAYEVLKDPEKRKRYDQLGGRYGQGQRFDPREAGFDDFSGFGGFGGGFPGGGFPGGGAGGWQNVQWSTGGPGAGGAGASGFSDFFEAMFGAQPGARGRQQRPRRPGRDPSTPRAGGDHEAELFISLEDALGGVTTTITLEHIITGPDGGRRKEEKTYNVKVPRGARDGMKIRLKGEGLAGHNGGPPGDLFLTVRFKPSDRYSVVPGSVDGCDLTARLPITPWEAALGAKVPFSTLDGEVKLTVPPGSSSGSKLRLKGKGLTRKDGERGSLTVELMVTLPPNLSDEEKALLEQWQSLRAGYDPR